MSNFADTLAKEFPFIKESMGPKKREPFSLFGVECGPGWNHILYEMCRGLQNISYRGRILQIKEKFGGLRVYYSDQSADTETVIKIAEKRAGETCEDCGAPGEVRGGGWLKVRCERCATQRKAGKF